jgi:hypothetical protein
VIVGIYDNEGWISDDYIISLDAQREFAGRQLSASGLVLLAAGADKGKVQDAIDAVLVDHPDAQVLDQDEYEEVASGFIDCCSPSSLRCWASSTPWCCRCTSGPVSSGCCVPWE